MKKWRCKNCASVSFLQLQGKCHLCRRIRTNHTPWLLKEILVLEKLLFYSLLWNIKTLSKSAQNQSKNGRICKYVHNYILDTNLILIRGVEHMGQSALLSFALHIRNKGKSIKCGAFLTDPKVTYILSTPGFIKLLMAL